MFCESIAFAGTTARKFENRESAPRSVLALEFADVLLGVELKADALDQIELGFEEVDVLLLVLHQVLEQVTRDIVLYAMAVGRGLLIERAGADLGGKIAFDDFLDVLADPQGIEYLHIGKAFEEQDAVGETVGVVHLLDGFLAPDLGHLQEAPIVEQAEMQPILIDRGQFATQTLVEIFDNFGVALHHALRFSAQRASSAQGRSEADLEPEQPFRETTEAETRPVQRNFRTLRARNRPAAKRPTGRGCAGNRRGRPERRPRAHRR